MKRKPPLAAAEEFFEPKAPAKPTAEGREEADRKSNKTVPATRRRYRRRRVHSRRRFHS